MNLKELIRKFKTAISGRLHSLVMLFRCYTGKHDREFWSEDKCIEEGVAGGAWTPYVCRQCGFESQIFKWPRE